MCQKCSPGDPFYKAPHQMRRIHQIRRIHSTTQPIHSEMLRRRHPCSRTAHLLCPQPLHCRFALVVFAWSGLACQASQACYKMADPLSDALSVVVGACGDRRSPSPVGSAARSAGRAGSGLATPTQPLKLYPRMTSPRPVRILNCLGCLAEFSVRAR